MRKLLTIIAALIMFDAYGAVATYWFDGNVKHAKNSCTSGGNIIRPSSPTKSGYKFKGWKVDTTGKYEVIQKLSSLVYTNGTSYTPANSTNTTTFTVTWSDGTVVTGQSACSSSGGNGCYEISGAQSCATSPTITNGTGGKCWCKLKNVKINNVTKYIEFDWFLLLGMWSTYNECSANCAYMCGREVKAGSESRKESLYRKYLFGQQ